jgi:hypothetical protein
MGVANDEVKKELLALKKSDLTMTFLMNVLGSTSKKVNGKAVVTPPKYDTQTKLFLRKGEYINTSDITTTIGRFFFNKLLIEGEISTVIPGGFVNEVVTKKYFKNEIISRISKGLFEKKLDINPTVTDFLRAVENYGLKLSTIFSPSYNMEILKPLKNVAEMKENLKTEAGTDVAKMADMEKKLLSEANKELADTKSMDLLKSGSKGTFDNNYKSMSLMKGPVANPITGNYDLISNNLMDGFDKEDIVAAANSIVVAEYPKAIGTREAGYLTKQFFATYQTIVLDDAGSDCGTTKCLTIKLSPDIVDIFVYQYIQEKDGSLIMLTDDNKEKYMNKEIDIRSPMYCINDKICNRCAGERYYLLGINNAGLTSGKISGNLLNARLKARHDVSIKMDEIDMDTALIKQ